MIYFISIIELLSYQLNDKIELSLKIYKILIQSISYYKYITNIYFMIYIEIIINIINNNTIYNLKFKLIKKD